MSVGAVTTTVAKRSMRIIAIPLTAASKTRPSTSLTYYHFITESAEKSERKGWMGWATSKAASTWADMSNAPKDTWKNKTFVWGERLMDRLDFEELALHTVDPSLGPTLIPTTDPAKDAIHAGVSHIPLVYPASVQPVPLTPLKAILAHRTPKHRKGCITWVTLGLISTPLAVVPGPNFPFYFAAWRAWSHWRAYKASEYLENLISQGSVTPEANTNLDAIYARYAPPPPQAHQEDTTEPAAASAQHNPHTPPTSTPSAPPPAEHSPGTSTLDSESESLLLTRDAVPALVDALALPEVRRASFEADVYRALEQARIRSEREGRKARGEEPWYSRWWP